MNIRLVASLAIAASVPLSIYAQFDGAAKGTIATGPGAGAVGILIVDAPTDIASQSVKAIEQIMKNMMDEASEIAARDQVRQQKEMEEAIGEPQTGITVEPYAPTVNPVSLAHRQAILASYKARPDAAKYQALILYLEALQTHELRTGAYEKRLNALIKANDSRLGWQERIRLAAKLDLLSGQKTLAQMDIRDRANLAIMESAGQTLENDERRRNRNEVTRTAEALSNLGR